MKKWIAKKMVLLLLSVSLSVCMSGAPLSAFGGLDAQNADEADAESKSEAKGATESTADAAPENVSDGEADEKSADNVIRSEYEPEARVEVDGKTVEYTDFIQAWKDMDKEGKTSTICLLKTINLYTRNTGGLKPGDTDSTDVLYMWAGNITLKMENGAKLYNNGSVNCIIHVKGGSFTLDGGEIAQENTTTDQPSALIAGGGKVVIKGEAKITSKQGVGIYVSPGENGVQVSIGNSKIDGGTHAVQCTTDSGLTLGDILDKGYAFQKNDGSGQWESQLSGKTTAQKVSTEQVLNFPSEPQDQTIIYGDANNPTLRAAASIVDGKQDAVNNKAITYKWFECDGNGKGTAISAATNPDYTPNCTNKKAGSYPYYCEVTCDWLSFKSRRAVVTIEKRPLTAEVLGEIVKNYDGKKEVEAGEVLFPQVQFQNVINGDVVTASAIRATFPSEKPGTYEDVDVTLSDLNGKDAENYRALPVLAKGRIVPLPITSVSLNKDGLSLFVGGSDQLILTIFPEEGTDKKVSWKSSNPSIASVDSEGKVTGCGAGSAVITATTADGKFHAECKVTVSGNSGSAGWYPGFGGIVTSPRKPFLKSSPAKQGWSVIRAEAVKAAEAGVCMLEIDMNGTAVVPGSFFAAIRGSEVTAVIDLDGGIVWRVFGKDISEETVYDRDFTVKVNAGTIPQKLMEDIPGSFGYLELKFADGGAFGFTATITAQIGKDEKGYTIGKKLGTDLAGKYANLYYYNPTQGILEFICADKIREDGTVSLPFIQGADYAVILSETELGGMDAPDTPQEGTKPSGTREPEKTSVQAGDVKLSKTMYTYDGKAKKPSVKAVDKDGNAIPGKYYTVSYQNNKKVGRATATVVFKYGYTGTIKKSFTIRPMGVLIKNLQAASTGFTVKWAKKTAQTSGYQIQYSTNANFKKNSTGSVYVKKASATKKTVKNLNFAKKYYVRIRVYKKVKSDGKSEKLYSVWSKAKRVKTRSGASEKEK